MKRIIKISALCFLVAVLGLSAEITEFKIISLSGGVTVKSGKNTFKAKINTKLKKGDEIKIADDGYVNLYADDGKTIELTDEGSYGFAKLAEKASKKKKSVASKLAGKIADELTADNETLKSSNLGRSVGLTGAGERAVGGETDAGAEIQSMTGTDSKTSAAIGDVSKALSGEADKEITVLSPGNSFIASQKVKFSWLAEGFKAPFTVTVVEGKTGATVFTRQTNDSIFIVDNAAERLVSEKNYFYTVVSANGKSVEKQFRIIGDSTAKIIEKEFEKSGADLDDAGAFEYAAAADFFAKRGIGDKAEEYYALAIAKSKGATEYKKIYAKYLISIGLYKYADGFLK